MNQMKSVCCFLFCLFSSEEVHTQSTESIQADEGSSASGPEKLPSFISLSSSPDMSENPDSPKIPPVAGLQAKGVYCTVLYVNRRLDLKG